MPLLSKKRKLQARAFASVEAPWVKLGAFMGMTGEELPKAAVQEAKAEDR